MIIVNINPEETYARVSGLWQYDYGQVLRIQGLSLPQAIEIHFSLQETGGEAITRIGVTKDGVTNVVIPDSILDGAGAIDDYFAYAFIYPSDDNSGQTEPRIEIGVKSRPKPEGYKGSGDDTMGAVMKAVNEIAAGKADGLEYKNSILRLMAGETELARVTISGGSGGEVTDEQISNAVDNYMSANPIEESDPTVPEWAKSPQKPEYTASEVGADAFGTAESKVSEHNVATDAHNDIRLLIEGLTTRLNALADSDDTTLDQMSEVVAYIKSNKTLIDGITTGKVSVSDIIDNLTTSVSNKPLSAAQGVKLKSLIDAIIVPTKLSELENDSGYAKTTDIPDKLPNPQKLTFAGAVTAEYDGLGAVTVTIPESSGGSGGTVRIEKLSTDTAVELEPNKLYIFPEMSELTITLAEPTDTGIANEYHFVFQSGATATTLSIPDTVKVPSNFSVDASKIYEISILEGCLCTQSWAVTA